MESKTQAEMAHEELRHRILILEIPAGQRLKEEEWAKKLQVSRAAIRECLTRLLGEGLVTAGERGGFFVKEATPDDMRELREVREIFESAAFTLACERATEAQIREIEATCDDYARMVQREYIIGAGEADLRFHKLLIAAANNSRLERAYQNSNIPLFQFKTGRGSLSKTDLVETEKQHRAIAVALRQKNVAKGLKQIKSHIHY